MLTEGNMGRVIPEIEKAYRKWRRSLAGNDVTGDARGRHKRSPEAREKMRQAALKRWAKVKRAA